MDAANLQQMDVPNAPARAGVLIVQNGRQAGARRPLGLLTTFIGRAPNCDIRLNVDGVDALHCVLVESPQGLQLRDLSSKHGTFVNGAPVGLAKLVNGDLVKVGPFQFRLERTEPSVAHEPMNDQQRDALRVQTAAVAAQQIALEEEEVRLDQRRIDLQRQEQQLATLLEEKQHQLQLWSDYARSEKEALRQEKLEFEKSQARQEEELAQAQNRLNQEQRELKQERQRINKIYQRLKQRWKSQWAAEREKHLRIAKKVQEESDRLEEATKSLDLKRGEFAQDVLRVNTERELSQRYLKDQRDALAHDQDRWRQRCALERHALTLKQREIDAAHGKLKQVRQMIQADKDAWANQQATLQKELVGLNNRVVNQRMHLHQLEIANAERAAHRKSVLPSDVTEPIECEVEILEDSTESALPVAIPAEEHWQRREAVLCLLMSELSDQRLHLIEQFQRLAVVHEDWRTQRERAATELESLAHRLIDQEQNLVARDLHALAQEHRVTERQEVLEGLRQEIEIWRAQLAARERTIQDEHARQLHDLQEREKSLDEQLASLAEMRLRWNQRRQQEVERQKAIRLHVDTQQKEVNELRTTLFANSQLVELEKRQIAEKSLALEQYRQELFARADDPNAQSRVERLRRRWLSINAGLIRNAKGERESARKELERLDDIHTQLARESSRLEQMETDLAEQQSTLDERDAQLKALQAKLQQENLRLGNIEHRAESSVLRMQEEVDTLAKAMYDAPDMIEKAA